MTDTARHGRRGRVPPHDTEAEQSVIGAVLMFPDALAAVVGQQLCADDFYIPTHATIFQTCLDVGTPLDVTIVADELRRRGQLDGIEHNGLTGVQYLHALANTSPSPGLTERHASIVHNNGTGRRLIRIAADLADNICDRLPIAVTLERFTDEVAKLGTIAASKLSPELHDDDDVSTWRAVDLTDALSGIDIEPPTFLARTDNVRLLYSGRVHWFQGESESLKSWAAQVAVADVLAEGGCCLYFDFEDDDRGVVARLRSLGVKPELLADQSRFRYVRPDEALYGRDHRALRGVVDLAAHLEHPWTIAVIDGVTEAMTTEGLELKDNTDVARWIRLLPRRIAATGAAVACIDHLAKAKESQGRYAVGGQHKLAGVTGATYKFVATKRLARAIGVDPRTGKSSVTVEKDRPGWVRARTEADSTIAVFEVTAWPDGGVTTRLLPPADAKGVPEWLHVAGILEYLTNYDGAATRRITEEVKGGTELIRDALVWLVSNGWVTVTHVGNAHRHSITDKGRAELAAGGEAR